MLSRIALVGFLLAALPPLVAALAGLVGLGGPVPANPAWLVVVAWQGLFLALARGTRIGRMACLPAWLATALAFAASRWHDGALPIDAIGADPLAWPLPLQAAALTVGLTLAAAGLDAIGWLRRRRTAPPDIREFYEKAVTARRILRDPSQELVVDRLQLLGRNYLAYRNSPRSIANPLGVRAPRGLYVWGPVGRGKSFLLDGFFDAVPVGDKRRFHFHELMRVLRRKLHELTGHKDAVGAAVRGLVPQHALVYIDEVHLADIDNARVFSSLLLALRRRGAIVCMSSNYAPDDLFDPALAPGGTARLQAGGDDPMARALGQILNAMDILNLDNERDYRGLKLTARDLYQDASDPETAARFSELFERLAEGERRTDPMTLSGRPVQVVRRAEGIVWCEWEALCESPRSYLDFLELAAGCHTVMVAGVPQLTAEREDAARRFAWLVEVLYDQRKRLILSAAVGLDRLIVGPFAGEARAGEFDRVVSRLREMQSTEYDLHLSTAAD